MGKKKVVIDTNIFISALGWGGEPNRLVNEIIAGKHELVISLKQIDELKKVLDYPKFDFSNETKSRFITFVTTIATIVDTQNELNVADDIKDNMILEIANESEIDFIITGDDDLLRLKSFKDTKIVSVKDFLQMDN